MGAGGEKRRGKAGIYREDLRVAEAVEFDMKIDKK